MRPVRSLVTLAFAVAALVSASGEAGARIYPGWSVTGTYSLVIDPAFKSVAGTFSYPLGGETASVALAYDEDGRLAGAGLAGGLTIFALQGSAAFDPVAGEQRIVLTDRTKRPQFTFEGTLSPTGAEIVGTFTKAEGYLDYPGTGSGPLALTRTSAAAQSTFSLAFGTRMDDHGRVRGRLDGTVESRATLSVYGGRVLEGGKIKGKVKTDALGVTTGSLAIVGRGWRVTLVGPIDAAGFHASCDINAAGFVVRGAQVLLGVQAGPPQPPGPPPKPPGNLLAGATATIVNGQVTISHPNVPSKFFGATAGLSVTFPFADGISAVRADVTTSSNAPVRRFVATVGGKAYGTATAPAGGGVLITIRKLSAMAAGQIEILATGKVYPSSGSPKNVDVIVQATVQ